MTRGARMEVDEPRALTLTDAKTVFLVWGPPSHGPRSRVLARELGIRDLHYIYCTGKRGLISAIYKYAYQAVRTLWLLFGQRPKLVFVQSPPSLAVLFVWIYCVLTGSQYVIDAHSAAFQLPFWTRPRWLHSRLARRAVTTIVTNERFRQYVDQLGGNALVLRDVPTTFPKSGPYPVSDQFNVVVINTYSGDEPLAAVLEAAANLEGFQFYVTGRKSAAPKGLLAGAPANVHFTDYLPDQSFYSLLDASDTVVCLTTRDNTMQRGACEALWMGKPIITSDWALLRDYFRQGTIHVDNTSVSIREALRKMSTDYRQYQAEIVELQRRHVRQWQEQALALDNLLQSALAKG